MLLVAIILSVAITFAILLIAGVEDAVHEHMSYDQAVRFGRTLPGPNDKTAHPGQRLSVID